MSTKEEQVPEGRQLEPDEPTSSSDNVDKCSCGHDRTHYMVSADPTYTTWGTFWITLMGVSSVPIRIDFRCRVCGETFDFIRDPEELKNYI